MILNTGLPNEDEKSNKLGTSHSLFIKYKFQELAYLVRTYFIIKHGSENAFGTDAKESLKLLDDIILLFKDGSSHLRVLALIDEFVGTAITAFRNCCYDDNRRVFIERLGWIGQKEYSYSSEPDKAFINFFFNILPDLTKELSSSRMVMKIESELRHISFDINGDICKIIGVNIISYHASRHEELIEELINLSSDSAASKLKKQTAELQANAKVEISEFLSILMEKKTDELSSLKSEYSNVNETYAKKIDNLIERANNNEHHSEELLKKANSLLESAKDIHGKTNREAMAGTFETISSELITPLRMWACGLVLSLVLIFLVGGFFYFEGIAVNLTVPQLLSRVFLIAPMVWLAWFSGRQYNHTSKLRQDYRYKSAVARAYHGYKAETGEENDKMHEHLLQNIVSQFSENPVRLYDKVESSMPVEEFLKKITPEHVVDIWKAAIQAKDEKDSKVK